MSFLIKDPISGIWEEVHDPNPRDLWGWLYLGAPTQLSRTEAHSDAASASNAPIRPRQSDNAQ